MYKFCHVLLLSFILYRCFGARQRQPRCLCSEVLRLAINMLPKTGPKLLLQSMFHLHASSNFGQRSELNQSLYKANMGQVEIGILPTFISDFI